MPPDEHRPGIVPLAGLVGLICIAWAGLIGWSLTSASVYLDHDELSAIPSLGGLVPLVGIFLAGWTLMVVASMLPALTRFAAAFAAAGRRSTGARSALPALLLGFVAPWIGAGAGFFLLDFAIHHLIAASPAVASGQQFIWPLTLLAVGAYELSPQKAHFVEHCCSSIVFLRRRWRAAGRGAQGLEVGLAQGLDSIAATWALMLLMFAAGFTGVGWLAVIALIALAESIALLRNSVRWATAGAIVGLGAGALAATASAAVPRWILSVTSPESGFVLLAAAALVGVAWATSFIPWANRIETRATASGWPRA